MLLSIRAACDIRQIIDIRLRDMGCNYKYKTLEKEWITRVTTEYKHVMTGLILMRRS